MAQRKKSKSRPAANELLPLSGLLSFRLVSIADSLLRAATKYYGRRFGINNAELRTLTILRDEQPLTIGAISRRGQIDKAWVSRSVANLLKRGLVKRKAHPTDSRMIQISLTATGVEVAKAIHPIAHARHLQLMRGLSPRETMKIIDILEKNAAELLSQSQEP